MKNLSTQKNIEELNNDFENVYSNKKELAIKYNAKSNKIKDVEYAIVLAMREERNSRTEFDRSDIMNFYRFDFPDKDLHTYLKEESIEFVKYLLDYLSDSLNKKRLKPGMSTYGLSPADKYLLKRYSKVLDYLTDIEDSNSGKNELIDKISNIIKIQLEDFRQRIILQVEKNAKNRYSNETPAKIEKYKNAVDKLKTQAEGLPHIDKEWRRIITTIQEINAKINRLNAIYRKYKTEEDFVDACVKAAMDEFESSIKTISEKILNKDLDIDLIHCKNVYQDPKLIEMTITDGKKSLYCRSILAAEYSTKMIPHFRFIITDRA